MAVAPRLSLVTLGVADPRVSKAFYTGLGWEIVLEAPDGFCLFRTAGAWLTLYPAAALAADSGGMAPAGPGFRGVTLAVNLEGTAEVDAALAEAAAAGGSVVAPAEAKEWGGYSGCFADPDGHVWEVAFNPHWPIGPDGRPTVE